MTDTPAAPIAPVAPLGASPTEQMIATAGGDGLSLAQNRDLVLHGYNSGIIDVARANKELALAGGPPLTDAELKPAPTAADMALAKDMPPGLEGGKINDFTLPDLNDINGAFVTTDGKAPPELTHAETIQIQTQVGGWLAAGEIPREIGSYLAKEAGQFIRTHPRYEQMEAGAKAALKISENSKLIRLWGSDKVKENVDFARAAVKHIESKRPGLLAFLDKTGVGDHATTIIHLALHGRRLTAKG
jgi:hypothetical protein